MGSAFVTSIILLSTVWHYPKSNINTPNIYIPQWNRVVLENMIVAQLVKKSPSFMEVEGSLPSSQEPRIDPILS
jgi:hypothetical protein